TPAPTVLYPLSLHDALPIFVGECRGPETLDMLQAMNTGHDGSLTTIHANSVRDCVQRIETMVMMAGFDLPVRAIRQQFASAVHRSEEHTSELQSRFDLVCRL